MGWCHEHFSADTARLKHHEPLDFKTSRILPQGLFVIWKLAVAVWGSLVIAISLWKERPRHELWLVYLTSWTFILEICFFYVSLGAAVVLLRRIHHGRIPGNNITPAGSDRELPPRKIGFFEYAHRHRLKLNLYERLEWVLWDIILAAAPIVAIGYWAGSVLTQGGIVQSSNTALTIQVHGVNVAVILVDLFITSMPFRWSHIYWVYIYAFAYLAFNLIWWGTGTGEGNSHIVYTVLNWNTKPGIAAAYIAGVFVVLIPLVYLVAYILYEIREAIWRACGGETWTEQGHVSSQKPVQRDIELGAVPRATAPSA